MIKLDIKNILKTVNKRKNSLKIQSNLQDCSKKFSSCCDCNCCGPCPYIKGLCNTAQRKTDDEYCPTDLKWDVNGGDAKVTIPLSFWVPGSWISTVCDNNLSNGDPDLPEDKPSFNKFTFTLKFKLKKIVNIGGTFAADNYVESFTINGSEPPDFPLGSPSLWQFGTYFSFTIPKNLLVIGQNTVSFVVVNDSNYNAITSPMGLTVTWNKNCC